MNSKSLNERKNRLGKKMTQNKNCSPLSIVKIVHFVNELFSNSNLRLIKNRR